jgi:hypothetical protein
MQNICVNSFLQLRENIMKLNLIILSQIFILSVMTFAQETKFLIIDGTKSSPEKSVTQPTVYKLSAEEIEAVKVAAMEKEVIFNADKMTAEASFFKANFAIQDVAEGYFIYREIQTRVYLYSAYSEKMKRNYQGIIVLRHTLKPDKYDVLAHYAYEYRDDKYIRQVPDINGNVLSEIAIFSNTKSKSEDKNRVRLIEFSPNGIEKMGSIEIYSSIEQKQRFPTISNGEKSTHIYSPPIVSAIKLYSIKSLGKPAKFSEENRRKHGEKWVVQDKYPSRPAEFEEDKTVYVELTNPKFPKGVGEK